MTTQTNTILKVSSEIGPLRKLLVHSPDSGLGRVVPSKAQDWLFEDIVHLDTIRRKEYDYYTKILLYFLDPELIRGKLKEIDDPGGNRHFFIPEKKEFFASRNVIELQWLLAEILENREIKLKLVASVCAIEGCSYETQNALLEIAPAELAKVFISGSLQEDTLLFPPIPNLIFTRDIGIVINDHILLNKPAKKARTREALIMKYIFFNHPLFRDYNQQIIELEDPFHHFLLPRENDERKVTLEGGDVMVVSRDHVLVGISERTTLEAAKQTARILFNKNIVKKVTLIMIPKKRDYMHIDTIFTQVKKNVWVMLGTFSRKAVKHEDGDTLERLLEDKKKEERMKITQLHRNDMDHPVHFDSLEELLIDISRNDLGCREEIRFIYSGNNQFPFDAREQWTDSCNLLALREGVVLGYDRNDKTVEAFREAGFSIRDVKSLINDLESGTADPALMEDTLIVIPSAELSRARGGFHCMSMPLVRDDINT